ncbi:transmembrane 220 family protein [Chitinophaga sp. GCM10012297]|uniref:Transmembrane 220 family protein n=1 Tax=Chitinophaga chungangae TaxID=2821488 RepID=A0ABS3YIP6_9BACT|nr:transmembrane 220 family protein [Chitinophaga chungangae]MBO9154565.1 transmembrane 220 family protein [Chitinophaga chungangae]
MKIFNVVFAVLFVLFAALQWNDPDPYIWMPIYLYGAVFCGLAAAGNYYKGWYLFGIVACLGYAVSLFFAKDGVLSWATEHHAENIAGAMKASTPWIEDTREFFGLFIIIVVLLVNFVYISQKRAKKMRKKMMKIG